MANAPNFRYDIGFIQTFDDDGTGCGGSNLGNPIEAYTGFLGWAYGFDPSSQHWDEFGYPQEAPFNGQDMQVSESSTGAVNPLGIQPDTVEVGNDLTGGSSGGTLAIEFQHCQLGQRIEFLQVDRPCPSECDERSGFSTIQLL